MYRGIKLPRFQTGASNVPPKGGVKSPTSSAAAVIAGRHTQKKQSVPSVSSVLEDILRRKDKSTTEPFQQQSRKPAESGMHRIEQPPEQGASQAKTPKSNTSANQPTAQKLHSPQTSTTRPFYTLKSGSPSNRSGMHSMETDRVRTDQFRRRLLDIEKESQRKSEIIKELEQEGQQQGIDFENELKRLTMDKKRVQESLVKKTIELETMKRQAQNFEQEKFAAKVEAVRQCEVEIRDLRLTNEGLLVQLQELRRRYQTAQEEIRRLVEVCRSNEYSSIELTSNELKLLDKLASLNSAVDTYSKELRHLNEQCEQKLEVKDKQLETMTRQLYELKKMNNLSHNGNLSKSAAEHELKKTIVRFQASQTLSGQLRSANSDLLKKSKSSERKAEELEQRVRVLALKQSSFQSENKKLKQAMVQMERSHLSDMQRKHEETLEMRETIRHLTQRLEAYVRACERQQSQEGSNREQHLAELLHHYRSELDAMTLRLQTAEIQLKRLRWHPVDSADSETVDRSIRQMIKEDISPLVREDDD